MTEPTPERPRIFLSYRRKDAAGHAGRLRDRLAAQYGQDRVFQDIDSIMPGADFAKRITNAVGSCHVLLALIGAGWLKSKDKGHRRLDNPNDYVRLEIEAALNRNILVIPILLDGATMPRADQLPRSLAGLAGRQALELSSTSARFDHDVARLIEAVDGYFSDTQFDEAVSKLNLSPNERATLEAFEDPQQRAIVALQMALQKQSRLASALANIDQMRHDMLKAAAQNFRDAESQSVTEDRQDS